MTTAIKAISQEIITLRQGSSETLAARVESLKNQLEPSLNALDDTALLLTGSITNLCREKNIVTKSLLQWEKHWLRIFKQNKPSDDLNQYMTQRLVTLVNLEKTSTQPQKFLMLGLT